ncbi:MAG: hypothetical protein MI861_28145 [Pirellulales bacterium]|nr:hypothetical protein [Pirellulales bacterium]
MISIERLDRQPAAPLAHALETFESEFRYPLGRERWFRISHGEDYTRFFRAIGHAHCFVARSESRVVGVVSLAHCRFRLCDGSWTTAAYISDLKAAPQHRGPTLLGLLRKVAQSAQLTGNTPGFSVVMDGTAQAPTSYTGRLGIPAFEELGKVIVLRIPTDLFANEFEDGRVVTASAAGKRFSQLSLGSYGTGGGDSALRSAITPVGIMLADARACGVLEDTRRSKLLYQNDGQEMVSAHLSSFACVSDRDGARLIRFATVQCRQLGFPALFVALPASHRQGLWQQLSIDGVVPAPATIFGTGLEPGMPWSINTAEI